MKNYRINPGGSLIGNLKVDGDKSISHRAIMFGALAEGTTRVRDILEGEDVKATISAFRKMGILIEHVEGDYLVHGNGLHGLRQPKAALDMGNSGTAFRLLAGILCGQQWSSAIFGDASLNNRPMGRIINPLRQMGAVIESDNDKPPLMVHPSSGLRGIRYELPVASAQVKSAILLAGLYAKGETAVKESAPSRDHTERMLNGFGYQVNRDGSWVSLRGGGGLSASQIEVPADLSSATFFILGALISAGSDLLLSRVGVNPSRSGILPILKRMGANVERTNETDVGGEPVADLRVRSSRLVATKIDANDVALAVDEIPAIAVAAARADGVTEIRGAEELRVKESDRISSTVTGLRNLGINVQEHSDGMTITGGRFQSGEVQSEGDHRIAMAFSMAANVASGPVCIADIDCVTTSFPNFYQLARQTGLDVEVVSAKSTDES
jgi:3-phosphoshikimate 1-carboxyvinyltransferase